MQLLVGTFVARFYNLSDIGSSKVWCHLNKHSDIGSRFYTCVHGIYFFQAAWWSSSRRNIWFGGALRLQSSRLGGLFIREMPLCCGGHTQVSFTPVVADNYSDWIHYSRCSVVVIFRWKYVVKIIHFWDHGGHCAVMQIFQPNGNGIRYLLWFGDVAFSRERVIQTNIWTNYFENLLLAQWMMVSKSSVQRGS